MPAIAFPVGLLLFALVLQDAFEVMLLPRRVRRSLRFVRFYFRQTWRLFSAFARRLPAGGRRERVLGVYGPLAMVLLFGVWSVGMIVGCGLMEWALHVWAGEPPMRLGEAFYLSGATFFTLGYGDVAPHAPLGRALAVLEAGTGLGFIAAVISYLPVLYQLFSRRETHVILLDGRAGSPPTAGGMILRHAGAGDFGALEAFLREWETWGAELLESQLSYPMLAFYRSQHDDQSWLAALACVMDTCALALAGLEDISPLQARMTFVMARQVIVQMADAFGLTPGPHNREGRLDPAARDRLDEALDEAKIGWRKGGATRDTLAQLRETYEPILTVLADYLLVPLPRFAPDPTIGDYWTSGYGGAQIRDLFERSAPSTPRTIHHAR